MDVVGQEQADAGQLGLHHLGKQVGRLDGETARCRDVFPAQELDKCLVPLLVESGAGSVGVELDGGFARGFAISGSREIGDDLRRFGIRELPVVASQQLGAYFSKSPD